jgi:predicted protein tyrosine phosphatase
MEAAMKIKAKPATAFVSTEKKHKGTVLHETGKQLEVVLAKQFEMEPCMVGMEASLTINLGDFNSARVACSLRVPCRHEEIDAVFEFTKEWVNDRLQAMADEVKSAE